jgi:hypothetical protein
MTRQLLVFALSVGVLGVDVQAQDDPWSSLRFLEGTWIGTADGRFGSGTVERNYSFVLDGTYLHERNISTYPPQERNPSGEIHEHWSFFSYDRARGVHVLRQFHDEAIVNQLVLNTSLTTGDRIVFDTESIENFNVGWRAREAYRVISNDEFIEEFYLAAPGKEFELFNTNHFRRNGDRG